MNQAGQRKGNDSQTLVIKRERPAGFFSNYFFVLEGMQEALDRRVQAVIGFPPQRNPKWKTACTKPELWSDYFDVQELATTSLRSSPPIYSQPSERLSDFSVAELHSLAEGQMKIRSHIKEEFEHICLSSVGTRDQEVLGVHFRGGDMYWHPNHPSPLLQSQLVSIVKQVLSEEPFNQIFVATDTPRFVRRLRRSVKVPVLSTGDMGLSKEFGKRFPVKNILLDAYILSKCSGLIHSQSNVSFASSVLRGVPYKIRCVVSLGRNPSSLHAAILKLAKRVLTPKFLRNESPQVKVERNEI